MSDCVLNDGQSVSVMTLDSMSDGNPIGFCGLHYGVWCNFLSVRGKLGLYSKRDYQDFVAERVALEKDWGIGARATTYLTNPAPWRENPYRLVSLGELVEESDARRLIALASVLTVLQVTANTNPPGPNDIYGNQTVSDILRDLHDLLAICTNMELTVSRRMTERCIGLIQNGEHRVSALAIPLYHLHQTVDIELETHQFLYIEPSKTLLYSAQTLFGDNVANAFNRTRDDIEEAGKCLALNRSTACVFHLMRVLEEGLYALANDLQIQNLQENWQNAIEQIEKAIRTLPKTDTRKQPYSEVASHFVHVKDAWRNRTMHAGSIYTEEKATRIFDNVKAFMQLLTTNGVVELQESA